MCKHNDTPNEWDKSKKREKGDFHQNIVVRFSLLTVIRLVSVVCVLGADFIASTNLSPNFIKANNGIYVTSTVCLQ